MGLVPVVGGGQQAYARIPPPAQSCGDVAEPVSGVEHLGADQMRGQVAVAESEPVGVGAVGGQFLFGMPGFPASAPSAIGVDAIAEGVHAGVEIRADAYAVHPRVVADVDHRRHLVFRGRQTLRQHVGERRASKEFANTLQKSGATDATNKNRHLHKQPA